MPKMGTVMPTEQGRWEDRRESRVGLFPAASGWETMGQILNKSSLPGGLDRNPGEQV